LLAPIERRDRLSWRGLVKSITCEVIHFDFRGSIVVAWLGGGCETPAHRRIVRVASSRLTFAQVGAWACGNVAAIARKLCNLTLLLREAGKRWTETLGRAGFGYPYFAGGRVRVV